MSGKMSFISPHGQNGLTVVQATHNVHLGIRSLLTDEYPDLARQRLKRSWTYLSFKTVLNYIVTSWKTWWGVMWIFAKMCIGGVSPLDFLMALAFALSITVILAGGLIICIICNIPILDKAYGWYAKKWHNGVSFINLVNSNMFVDFTEEELKLAKEAMSAAPPQESEMNIDIAKIMLLFSGLVYERSIEEKKATVARCSTMDWSHLHDKVGKGLVKDVESALLPNHQHLLFSKRTGSSERLAENALHRASATDLYSPGPSGFPNRHSLYGTFPKEFSTWQQAYVSESPYSSPVETTSSPVELPRTSGAAEVPSYGANRRGVEGGRGRFGAKKDSGVIHEAMIKWGFEFEAVSELDSDSSAYSAAFWDRGSNWVVIAFKGTTPPEFDEWLVDFDYTRVPVGEYIPGYGSVHHGIKNRLFPDEPTINRTPYETIVASLKIITDDLLSRTNQGFVNVYLTGHSLGGGIASLAYGRLLMNIDGLDPRVKICDSYLFSAPIVSDMDTARLFNKQLVSGPNGPRRVWRLINHHDAVATLFPAMGDDPRYPYPDSLFAFTHLGTEVKMRRKGTKSIVENNYAPVSSTATAVSALPEERVGVVPQYVKVAKWMIWAQYVPLAGWMFSHFPGLYFESIEAMQEGEMEWQRERKMD